MVWTAGDTGPAVIVYLDLGSDPLTGEARTLVSGDTVHQHMRPPTGPVITRELEIVAPETNGCRYKPAAGDLVLGGEYRVEFDRTSEDGLAVETIPGTVSDPSLVYRYFVRTPV